MQATTPPSDRDKSSWRKYLKQLITQISNPEACSATICSHLNDWLNHKEALKIAAFSSLHSEPNLSAVIFGSGPHSWYLPRVTGNEMHFYNVRSPEDLEVGSFGIMEPRAGLTVVSIDELDCILCPGLGFGRDGSRLGRGKGYYDRALENCKRSTLIMGVGFTEQVVDSLPCEDHDKLMTHLLTPDGIIDLH